MDGFSKTNLYNIKRFYQFYEGDEFFHHPGGKFLGVIMQGYLLKRIPLNLHIFIYNKPLKMAGAEMYWHYEYNRNCTNGKAKA